MMTTQETTSGSGLVDVNITCDTFFQLVIAAIESLNVVSEDDNRSVVNRPIILHGIIGKSLAF